jgi:hypothetical protein
MKYNDEYAQFPTPGKIRIMRTVRISRLSGHLSLKLTHRGRS